MYIIVSVGTWYLRCIKVNYLGGVVSDTQIFDGSGLTWPVAEACMAIDGNDKLHLVFEGQALAGTYQDILYMSCPSGGSWSAATTLVQGDDYGYSQYTPDIQAGPDNQLHVVWWGQGWSTYTTMKSALYRKYNGLSWESPVVLYNQIDHHHSVPVVAVDGSGYVHVAWVKQDPATYARWLYYKVDTGSGFGPAEEITAYLYAIDQSVSPTFSLAVSQDGKVHCVWLYGGASYVWRNGSIYASRRVGGSWEAKTIAYDSDVYCGAAMNSYWPRHHSESLNMLETGVYFIVFDYGNLDVEYAKSTDFDDAAIRFTPYVNTGAQTAQEGVANHQLVADYTPNFSAIYPYRLGMTATATHYRIVVKDGTNFDTAVTYWDSGQQALSPTCSQGSRCHDIVYGNVGSPTALDDETPRLYWLIKFWDSNGAETEWSGTWTTVMGQYFQVTTGAEYWMVDTTGYTITVGSVLEDSLVRRYDGRLYIAATALRPSTGEYNAMVFYSDNDGEAWSNFGFMLPGGAESVEYVSIACDSVGTLHLVASVYDGANIDVYYYYMLYGSSSWSSPSLLKSNIHAGVGTPHVRLRCDNDDNLHCFVSDTIATQFWYAKYTYGLGWGTFTAMGADFFPTSYISSWDAVICGDRIALVMGGAVGGVGVAVRDIEGVTWVYLWIDPLGTAYDDPPYYDAGNRYPQATYDPDNDDLVISIQDNYDIIGTIYPFASIWRVHLPDGAVSTSYGNTDDYWYRYYFGYAYKTDADYATARTAATGTGAGSASNQYVGQLFSTIYYVYRGGMRFDCRNWPSGTVSEAYVTFFNDSFGGGGTPTVHMVDGDYLDWPMTTADYGEIYTYGTSSFGSVAMGSGTKRSITLNSSGIAKVQAGLGDFTQFALRTTNDMNGTPPTGEERRQIDNQYDDAYTVIPRLYAKIDGVWYTSGYWDISGRVVTWALNNTSYSTNTSVTRSLDNKFHYSFYKVLSDVNGPAGCWRRTWDEDLQTWEDAEHLDSLAGTHAMCDVQFPTSAVADTGYFFLRSGSLFYGISEDGSWPEEPLLPDAPTGGYCEGSSSSPPGPTIDDFTPEFSAIYNDPNSGDATTKYEIEVGTDTDWGTAEMWDSGEQTMASCTEGTRCADISYDGSALNYDTEYYWRIRFKDTDLNDWGDWSWVPGTGSTYWEFTTEEYVAGSPEAQTDAATDYLGGTSMILHGTLVDTGGATPLDYRFIYDTDTGYPYSYNTSWVIGALTAPSQTFQETVYTDPATTYYFRAEVRNINGSDAGDQLSVLTGGGAPTVLTVAADNITDHTGRLKGTLVNDTGMPCEYSFLYGYSAGSLGYSVPWSGPGDTKTTGETFSYTLTGLDYGVTIYYRAQCRNDTYTGYGGILNFTTGEGSAGVNSLSAVGVSSSSATLRGYLVEDGGEDCDVAFEWGTTGQNWGYLDTDEDEAYGILGTGDVLGQTFTISATGDFDVYAVGLKLYREGAPGTVDVEIWTVDGGNLPDTGAGSKEAEGSFDGDSLTGDTDGEWVVVDMGTPVTLSASVRYAIVLRVEDGDTSNSVHWRVDNGGAVYSNGEFCAKSGAGAWAAVTSTAGMFAVFDDWTDTTWQAGFREGTNFSAGILELTVATAYRFRAKAQNGSGEVYGSTLVFISSSYTAKPSGLEARPISGTEISLTWIKGSGAYQTLVRYKAYEYPSSYTDGGLAYKGDSNSVLVSGLSSGVSYYFRAWTVISGADGDEYLTVEPGTGNYEMDAGSDWTTVVEADLAGGIDDYYVDDLVVNVTRGKDVQISDFDLGTATITLISSIVGQTDTDEFYIEFVTQDMATTKASAAAGAHPYQLSDTEDSNWFTNPSDGALSFLPGRAVLEETATDLGMGVGNLFFFIAMLLACGVSFAAFLLSRSMFVTIISVGVFLLLCMVLSVVPGWVMVVYLVVGMGGGYALAKSGQL
jgi:hypothetical protein